VELVKKTKEDRVSDENLLTIWIATVLESSSSIVADYKKGKVNAISVLIGKVMQLSKGRADAHLVRKLLEQKLSDTHRV
jgi:aspartyl-tRNA(Asn)/glutamyl-tRNA(Gln) amidotransferase subunit B